MSDQSEAVVRRAYNAVSRTYAGRLTSVEAEQPIDLAMLELFASRLTGGRAVLDAGCGAGRLLPFLRDLGCDVQGVDLSPEMVQQAQERHPSFHVETGSLSQLPFPDESFDGLVSWYSTIHTPDSALSAVFAEIKRVLRPDGLAALGFQTGNGERDLSAIYRPLGHDVNLLQFNRPVAQMAERLAEHGFDEVARMERAAARDGERDGQAVLIVQRRSDPRF